MKNKIIALLLFATFLFSSSCKKEKTTRDYSALNDISTSTTLPVIDSTTAQQLFDLVATDRNAFNARLEINYPGLKDAMDADIATILSTYDSAQRETLMQNFDVAYNSQVQVTWNDVSSSFGNLQDRYRTVLGDIPFTVGDFGTIAIIGTPQVYVVPAYPFDSSIAFLGYADFAKTDGCGALAGNVSNVNAGGVYLNQQKATAQGCGLMGSESVSTTFGNRNVIYYSSQFAVGLAKVSATTFATGSFGGYCSSSIDAVITNGSGTALNTRAVLTASAIAPIVGRAHVVHEIAAGTRFDISARNDFGFVGGTYTSKLVCKTEIGAAASAIAESYVPTGVTYVRKTNHE